MDKGAAINIVKRYKEALQQYLPVKAIYLYGSYSKGLNTDESDIDVAVIVPEERDNWMEDAPLLWRVGRSISTYIEPILLNEGEDSPLYGDITSTGIEV